MATKHDEIDEIEWTVEEEEAFRCIVGENYQQLPKILYFLDFGNIDN